MTCQVYSRCEEIATKDTKSPSKEAKNSLRLGVLVAFRIAVELKLDAAAEEDDER